LTHHNLSDKEIKDNEVAAKVEQTNSGVEELPAMQDTASVPANPEKLKTKKGSQSKKGGGGKQGAKGKGSSSGYTGLNKYRTDMICSSDAKPMTQTGAITTEEIQIAKRLPPRGDGKPAYKPLPGVGANKALAVVCDDCIRQSKPPEEGGTNMPITYKTVVVMTQEGKVINVPISSLR
jgi:hypothetical protein